VTGVETESVSWLRIVLAFVIVFGLLGLMGFALKYVNQRGIKLPGMGDDSRRLKLIESLSLDVGHRLVIVKRDDKEHLLLLGSNHDIVVETNMESPPPAPFSTKIT